MNHLQRAWGSVKAAATSLTSSMRFGRGAHWGMFRMGRSRYNYAADVGDGSGNSAVMACIRWAQRAFPEAPLQVMLRDRTGDLKPAPDHDLQVRLESPNPYYSGLHLMAAVLADLMLTGNAYIRKIRGGGGGRGRVVELWWMPSWMVEPRWPDTDPSVFIGWYDYTVDGVPDQLDPADVIHIRQGFDPRNIRKGLSDIAALVREIATDDEAANWTASVVRNGAPPGVILSPEGDVDLEDEDAEDVKDKFNERFGDDNRGSVMVMHGPTKVSVLSYSPEQMNLRTLRQIPEERITALIGIPAAVVGLGAGLDQTKVGATLRELREQAYESSLVPIQRLIAAELQLQLVPDYGDPAKIRVQFDISQIRVLQDDQNKLHERARADLLAGGIELDDFLQMIGKEALPGSAGKVRYIPHTITVTPSEDLLPKAPPETPPASDQPPADDAAGQNALPAPAKALTDGGDAVLPLTWETMRVPRDAEGTYYWGASAPAPALANGHTNGVSANGKADVVTAESLGPALRLSDEDLDRASKVGPDDLDASEKFWRESVDGTGLEGLIEAEPDEGE